MSKPKGLKPADFWITVSRRIEEKGRDPYHMTTIELRTGYLFETNGLVFGLTRLGPKLVEATEILTGLRVLSGVTYAGTAEKLAEMPPDWFASVYRVLSMYQDKEDWERLEPGMRTLGGDKVLEVLDYCQKRRPRV